MEYTKIKISLKEHPKRLYRVLAIKGNPDLYQLGAIIGLSVEAWFEHLYLFRKKNVRYVVGSWMDGFFDERDMAEHHMLDLGDNFYYEYDTGEGYVFNCKIYKNKINYVDEEVDSEEEYPAAYVLEGVGQGIFENDHYTLDKYLYGDIDPESSKESYEDKDFQLLPQNLTLEKYGDFDNPLDIENMFYEQYRVDEIANHFKEMYGERSDEYLDEDDEIDDDFETFVDSVAGDIFKDENINTIFKELLKYYDLNVAFAMVLKTTAQTFSDESYEGDYYQKRIDDLKKLLDIKH